MASRNVSQGEAFWLAFERLALVFSFTMSVVLLVVVLVLLGFLLPIRDQIARPTMDKVMAEIDRLGSTHIKTTIPVKDSIRVKFDLPLSQKVDVTTTEAIPLTTDAYFVLPGGGGYIQGTVSIELPANTTLPVQLNTTVPVDQEVPVEMDVDVDIDLAETDLKTSVDNFKALLKPVHQFLGE